MNGMLEVFILLLIHIVILWWLNRREKNEMENNPDLEDSSLNTDPWDMSEEAVEKFKEVIPNEIIKSEIEQKDEVAVELKVDNEIEVKDDKFASVQMKRIFYSAISTTLIATLLFLHLVNVQVTDPVHMSTRDNFLINSFIALYLIPILLWIWYAFKSSRANAKN